jgi:hypothetical protein
LNFPRLFKRLKRQFPEKGKNMHCGLRWPKNMRISVLMRSSEKFSAAARSDEVHAEMLRNGALSGLGFRFSLPDAAHWQT